MKIYKYIQHRQKRLNNVTSKLSIRCWKNLQYLDWHQLYPLNIPIECGINNDIGFTFNYQFWFWALKKSTFNSLKSIRKSRKEAFSWFSISFWSAICVWFFFCIWHHFETILKPIPWYAYGWKHFVLILCFFPDNLIEIIYIHIYLFNHSIYKIISRIWLFLLSHYF